MLSNNSQYAKSMYVRYLYGYHLVVKIIDRHKLSQQKCNNKYSLKLAILRYNIYYLCYQYINYSIVRL